MAAERLKVLVLAAQNLPSADFNGYSDPYVEFLFRNIKHKTKIKKRNLNPVWNEVFILDYDRNQDERLIRFFVWDYNFARKPDFLGSVTVDLHTVSRGGFVKNSYSIDDCPKNKEAKLIIELESIILPEKKFGNQVSGGLHRINNTAEIPTQTQSSNPYGLPACNQTFANNQDVSQARLQYMQPRDISPIEQLQGIFPNHSAETIKLALEQASGNVTVAVDILLTPIFAEASITNEPTSNYPALGNPSEPSASEYTPGANNNLQQQHGNTHLEFGKLNVGVNYSGQGRRKALLIGINYTNQRQALRGCQADVQRMRKLLIDVYRFPSFPAAMVCLTDDNPNPSYQPTKKNILYALRWLVADSRPGDVFFFHFSGHGSQIRSRNNTEEDGLDETILPVDFQKAGMITDNEMHDLLVKPLCNGARLTAVMDCCHSGTGMDLPFVWLPKERQWEIDGYPYYTQGDVQLFSGCMDDEVSVDLKSSLDATGAGGAMTTAFVSLLSRNPHGFTYNSLLSAISSSLKSRKLHNQTPSLTSAQTFDMNRIFNLTDILTNKNPVLGYPPGYVPKRKPAKFRRAGLFGDNSSLLLPILMGSAIPLLFN